MLMNIRVAVAAAATATTTTTTLPSLNYPLTAINGTTQMTRELRVTNNEFVFLAVDNDGCNLLIHEDKYSCKQSGQQSSKYPVPPDVQRVHQPATLWRRWLKHHTQHINTADMTDTTSVNTADTQTLTHSRRRC